MNSFSWEDTIAAIATAPGVGAIAVIRMSGNNSIEIADKIFKGRNLKNVDSHTLHFGSLEFEGKLIDEVLVSVFRNPKSFTGEDSVEISCHGSIYIQQTILEALVANGARLANPGEFTQRAFLNGKMDLTQAEAVADLIAADNKASQNTALNQMRGGFSNDLKSMREQLINFTALLELELDFSEEDVEFADRKELKNLIKRLRNKTIQLIESFKLGNAIRNGVSVAIIGKPNAGKSTLLNALLNDERAIVSDIAGTTRDTIEEVLNINGISFRLIDTAGIREHSTDVIENIGMERSKKNAEKADIILYLQDLTDPLTSINTDEYELEWLKPFDSKVIVVKTKLNKWNGDKEKDFSKNMIDAKEGIRIEELRETIYNKAMQDVNQSAEGSIVTNVRHYEALKKMDKNLAAVEDGINNNLSGDLVTIDIRQALHYLGIITGQVEIDRDVLGAIFSKFCIGK